MVSTKDSAGLAGTCRLPGKEGVGLVRAWHLSLLRRNTARGHLGKYRLDLDKHTVPERVDSIELVVTVSGVSSGHVAPHPLQVDQLDDVEATRRRHKDAELRHEGLNGHHLPTTYKHQTL